MLVAVVLAADPYSDALLSLKSDIIDDSKSLDDWKVVSEGNISGKILACSWSGVECNENSTIVTSLNLCMKNLAGKLPGKQLGVLTQLVGLNISQNSFSGELPGNNRYEKPGSFDALSNSFSGPLPVEVTELESLKVLNLAGSYFDGPIPSSYGSFKRLEYLHLAGNSLTGKIPPELGNLKTMTHMEIGYNFYEGNIPWQLSNMSELQYLDIAGSNLSGSIPRELSNLTKLESLFLFRNRLTGPIPWEFSRIVPLTDLDLSDNLISGPIPESFAELKNLRLLSLMFNEMNGTVPESLAELPSMETLFIWNNFFTGTLPKSLGINSKLRWLDVSNNSFIGSIPPGICTGGKLFKLMLFSNNFTGNLSPLSNCSSLVRIRVEDNSFSGEIPLKFSDFPDITYIDLSKNRFTGGIPWDISRALKLQYFSVANNPELGGTIPENIWSLPFLQNFSASYCNISGNLPPFRSCKSIVVVQLRMNNISGSIPESISDCHSLEMINLGSNHLTDNIPKELASLPSLVFVDLSHNDLVGSIPVEFGKSSSLVLLNVSYNDISGTIPSKKVLRSMGRTAYIGNPELCGKPLKSCSNPINGKKLRTATIFRCILQSSAAYWDNCAVKKLEWEPKRVKVASEFITQLGSARHMNLIRLLGFCYNKQMTYLLYDYLPNGNLAEKLRMQRDWGMKCRIMIGIAKGICFLHHDCNPAIPHGNLKSSNVIFDDNSEPRLANFGFKHLMQLIKGTTPASSRLGTGESNDIKEELYKDIYNFGEIILEILSNGKLMNGGASIHIKPKDAVLREIYHETKPNPPIHCKKK
ncbi:dicer-like protein 4-like isoform X1 [Hibiscus syriacus]|uniref:Dicer-like protein 4-like isoform X1 n=1 Tax=Hibiscus syriacus TaxID=106335 RepID=A0A6A2ZAI0_HIBSY|nr:dicer-like protein 4-like isoform X1 [Hibiscus syriacus]